MKRISRKNFTMKKRIYLDDVRTPIEKNEWVIVRSYDEFVEKINEIGLENISLISLDHDLGDTAMKEWHRNVYHNYTLDYNNITEKTGKDAAWFLINHFYDQNPNRPKMSIEDKHVLSHRGKAFRALAKKLDESTRSESPTA
jgi:hypothetical protein